MFLQIIFTNKLQGLSLEYRLALFLGQGEMQQFILLLILEKQHL